MKTLSIRQPWAWLIVNGYKGPENRTWNTKHRGVTLIHAGCKYDIEGHKWVNEHFPQIIIPPNMAVGLGMGGIVGRAMLSDVVTESKNKFFTGPFAFIFTEARPLPFMRCKGRLGFFDVDYKF